MILSEAISLSTKNRTWNYIGLKQIARLIFDLYSWTIKELWSLPKILFHAKSKHNIRHHFIQELVEKKKFLIEYLYSQNIMWLRISWQRLSKQNIRCVTQLGLKQFDRITKTITRWGNVLEMRQFGAAKLMKNPKLHVPIWRPLFIFPLHFDSFWFIFKKTFVLIFQAL